MNKEQEARILIVEDDSRMRESIRVLLSAFGYETDSSSNISDALASLENKAYDLIILDLLLADRSGFELLDHLEAQKLDAKVIILTGQHSEKKVITAFKKRGVVDFLHKPYESDTFILAVKNALNLLRKDRDQRLLNKKISSSRKRYIDIIDSQKNYLCYIDSSFEITFINRIYAECIGKTPRQLIGKPYLHLVHKSIQRQVFSHLETVVSGSPPITVEFKIDSQNKERKPHWLQWHFRGIRDERGNVLEIQCVGNDVTLNRIHAEQIERKKEKYRQLAEITSDWIWEVDKDGIYTYSSPVVYDILGYWPEEVIGKRPFDFMPKEEAKRVEPIFQNAVSNGNILKNIENINCHKNGSLVTLETNGVPITDYSGGFIGYRGIDRDISDRKNAERALIEEKEKLKEALEKVKRLSGMLPICASCKKIRDDKGYWQRIESYISEHSEAAFSHGLCPKCAKKLYPEIYDDEKGN